MAAQKPTKRISNLDEFCTSYQGGLGLAPLIYITSNPYDAWITNTESFDKFIFGRFMMNIPFLAPMLAMAMPLYLIPHFYQNEYHFEQYGLGLLMFYILIEFLFIFYYRWTRDRLCANGPVDVPEFTHQQQLEMTTKIAERENIEEFICGWFMDEKKATPKFDAVKCENMKAMLAANFHIKSLSNIDEEGMKILKDCISIIEAKTHVKFEEGFNPKLSPYQNALDPLRVSHHPLSMYLFSYLGEFVCSCILRLRGFRHSTYNGISYWYIPNNEIINNQDNNNNINNNTRPLVFLHGIGIGLGPYLHFIQNIMQNRPTILVNLPWVSLRLEEKVPAMADIVSSISEIMKKHDITSKNKCTAVGHSYGTFVLSALVRNCAELIHTPVFIDPVCFSLYLPDVVRNFVYARPSKIHDWIRYFVVSRDLYISNVLCRNFYWYGVNMWPEELPPKSIVILGGKDEISPNHHVKASLEKRNDIDLVFHDEIHHAEILVHHYKMSQIIDLIELSERN